MLVDTGAGSTGWRQLLPTCLACVGARPRLEMQAFARLAGHGVTISGEAAPIDIDVSSAGQVALLHAEMALLQARLDDLQSRFEAMTRGNDAS